MEETIKVSEALEYCERCAKVSRDLMFKALDICKKEMNMNTLGINYQACNYFQMHDVFWTYDAPNMIKALADGTWREHFEEEKTDESE